MSTKHPAEVLSYRCEQALLEYELPATVEQLMQDCAEMLRTIPALVEALEEVHSQCSGIPRFIAAAAIKAAKEDCNG